MHNMAVQTVQPTAAISVDRTRYFRYFLMLISAIQLFFAIAYIFQFPFAVAMWPLGYTSTMSFIFVGSIFAAAAASTFWCAISREDGALAGIALDYLTIFGPMAIFAFQIARGSRSGALQLFGVACVIGAVFGAAMFLWSRRIPIKDTRPQPRVVRYAFIFFIGALVLAGSTLVTKTPNILPWSVTSEGSVVYGWIFFGAATYFTYSVLRPSWHNSVGQLLGFLAYDIVLIIPFLTRLPTIDPRYRVSLYIYTAVVTVSGIIAFYYLFVHPGTRLQGRPRSRQTV